MRPRRRDPNFPLPDSPESPVYKEILERAALGDWRLYDQQALNDFWFFCRYVSRAGRMLCEDEGLPEWFGRPWFEHPWVFARCREVQANPNGFLDLWPRFHFKTTIITQLLTLWDLADNPELRIAIITNKIASMAENFLAGIKQECEKNAEMLSAVFPWAFWQDPAKDCRLAKLPWNNEQLTMRKESGAREASVVIGSLEAGLTSGHYDIRVYDDLVTEKSVSNPESIAQTTQRWQDFAGTASDSFAERYVGTHWSVNDTYRTILDRGVVKLRRHDVYQADGTTPVLRSAEWVHHMRVRMGVYSFACQMRNSPISAGLQTFVSEWFSYDVMEPEDRRTKTRCYMFAETAGHKKKSDYHVIWVVGLGRGVPYGFYYVHDCVRDRLGLVRFGEVLFDMVEKWRPEVVFLEQVGAMRDEEYLKSLMIEKSVVFTIRTMDEKVPKEDRIQRLQPYFESKRIFFPRTIQGKTDGLPCNLVETFKHEEYLIWSPTQGAPHDDMLDCLAWIASPQCKPYLRFPVRTSSPETESLLNQLGREGSKISRYSRRSPWSA